MTNASELFAQVLESARKELSYAEHRIASPKVVTYTVVRKSDVGGMTACRIIEHGKDFTKYNFAGDASTACNLTRPEAERLLAMVLDGRSDFDIETASYSIITVQEWLEARAEQLRGVIAATEGLPSSAD